MGRHIDWLINKLWKKKKVSQFPLMDKMNITLNSNENKIFNIAATTNKEALDTVLDLVYLYYHNLRSKVPFDGIYYPDKFISKLPEDHQDIYYATYTMLVQNVNESYEKSKKKTSQ